MSDDRLAPTTGFITDGSSTYRYRLETMTNSVARWTVTRTEAAIVETPARANQATLEAAILADFGPDVAGEPLATNTPGAANPIDVREVSPGEVCGACGAWVPGGSDPSVMSAHDCESEEQ